MRGQILNAPESSYRHRRTANSPASACAASSTANVHPVCGVCGLRPCASSLSRPLASRVLASLPSWHPWFLQFAQDRGASRPLLQASLDLARQFHLAHPRCANRSCQAGRCSAYDQARAGYAAIVGCVCRLIRADINVAAHVAQCRTAGIDLCRRCPVPASSHRYPDAAAS